MRVLAHLCADAALLRVFAPPSPGAPAGDIYAGMAALAFGVPVAAAVTPAQRLQAKTVVLGLVYGMGLADTAAKLGLSESDAAGTRAAFQRRFPGVQQFVRRAQEFTDRHGYAPTLTGRRRDLPEIRHADGNRKAYARRQAVNSVVQGTAADLIKVAMVLVDGELRVGGGGGGGVGGGGGAAPPPLPGRLLLQIHDELLFECPAAPAAVAALVAAVTRIMTTDVPVELARVAGMPGGLFDAARRGGPASPAADAARLLGGSPELRVPLCVSVEVGDTWGHMVPWRA